MVQMNTNVKVSLRDRRTQTRTSGNFTAQKSVEQKKKTLEMRFNLNILNFFLIFCNFHSN